VPWLTWSGEIPVSGSRVLIRITTVFVYRGRRNAYCNESGHHLGAGVNVIKLIATDACGLADTCEMTLTVTIDQPRLPSTAAFD